jgi:hypothetical protein
MGNYHLDCRCVQTTATGKKRPGPFAQNPSRTPPMKEQREKDYQPEKKETGEAMKKQGKDDLG